MYRDSESPRSAAQSRRDALLSQVTRTRWLTVAGAGALSAALAALVGAAAPGRSSAKTNQGGTKASAQARHTVSMPPAADAAQLGLRPPGSAPQAPPTAPSSQAQSQPAPATPAPVSGGS